MIHLRRQPSHNAIVDYRESPCCFSDDSSEISTMADSKSMADEEDSSMELKTLSAEQEAAPPRKKARTERNKMRSIRRRGALDLSLLLKNVMVASMADNWEDDQIFEAYDPLRGSKRRRDSENCTESTPISEHNLSGVDVMFTLMSMKPRSS
jgi:hypothetical protein